jgi:hypothetical protein
VPNAQAQAPAANAPGQASGVNQPTSQRKRQADNLPEADQRAHKNLAVSNLDDATEAWLDEDWHEEDEATSELFTQAEVEQAKLKELESLNSFKVYVPAKETEVPMNSRVIATRWVLTRKPSGDCKARLVCKDFKKGSAKELHSYASK